MSSQKITKLEVAMEKEPLLSIRWRMLDLQKQIEFTKDQIEFWKSYQPTSEESAKITQELLASFTKDYKNLLKKAETI